MDPGSIFILVVVGVLALIGAALLAMTVIGVDARQGGRRRARPRPSTGGCPTR